MSVQLMQQHAWSEHDIAQALAHLDAGCDRDEWVRVGMAVKAELGDAGFEIWNEWSRSAPEKYSANETRSTWRSIKQGGRVTIGTLIDKAKQNGFVVNLADRQPMSAEEVAERKARREAAEQAAKEQERQGREQSQQRASGLWRDAAPAPANHPYIVRKRGTPDGLRVVNWPLEGWNQFKGKNLEGWLMVPAYSAGGKLMSVQFIGPNAGEKLNAKGCKQALGTFTLGTLTKGQKAYVVEGIGHAWSVNAVTGCAAVVTFGASNTEKAAAAIRKAGAVPVIVPDRGKENQAQAAARAYGYEVATLPQDLPDGADINDLHLERGEAAVLAVLERKPEPKPQPEKVVDVHNMTPVLMSDWPFISPNGQPQNTRPNVEVLLNNYRITARYNEISKDVEVVVPGFTGSNDARENCAISEILSLAALNRLPVNNIEGHIKTIAAQNSYNPVRDFIDQRPWDGRSRFADLLATISTPDDYSRDLLAMLVRRWLLSAVAAAYLDTGFWSKGVLVFQGEQSLGKTAWFKALLPPDSRSLVKVGATIDPSNKDSVASAIGHWLVELGELDATFRKADIAKLKAFISQDRDDLRRPYDRLESRYQRRTVFFASVNPKQFLADDTGNVRWWTIPVTAVNYEHGIDTQQLWAEVLTWFKAGERWWLERHEEAQLEAVNEQHGQTDPIEEMILARFDWNSDRQAAYIEMTSTDVLLAIGQDRPTKSQATQCGNILRKLTGRDARRTSKGRFYLMPPKVLGQQDRSYFDERNQPF